MNRRRLTLGCLTFLATWIWLGVEAPLQGPASLWPSLVAIGLAFLVRDIHVALFTGALAGAVLLREGNPVAAFLDLFAVHLIPALQSPWNLSVLIFTLLMGGLVEVLHRGGGMTALTLRVLGRATSRRRAGLGAYAMGWMLFFDGLANAMLVGKSMRGMADRAGLSRAKLAFIIDSTSAPIAGVALISTWIAYEMSMIQEGFGQTGNPALAGQVSPFALLVASLPHRYYCYYLLLVVFLVIWLARDLGPMRVAEARAFPQRLPADAGPDPAGTAHPGRIWLALGPLAFLVAAVFGGLYLEGGGWGRPLTLQSLIEAFGAANAALVFVWATAAASLVALVLALVLRGGGEAWNPLDHFFGGMQQMFRPALILVFAWTLNGVIRQAGTAEYLVGLLGEGMAPTLLPATVFLLGALISFSTGTSWGTMALLMPLVVPVAVAVTGTETTADMGPVLVATIGAVLTGAVFGDHCSPISDTTIVSAFSSECDVMEHVRTQLPYATGAALVALLAGYLPAGLGWPPWVLLPAGGLACWAWVRYGGKSRDQQPGTRERLMT